MRRRFAKGRFRGTRKSTLNGGGIAAQSTDASLAAAKKTNPAVRFASCSKSELHYREHMKAKVIVTPKKAVLDPQGNAVRDAMRHLGMPEVRSVRIGKYMEIDVEGEDGDLERRLHGLCRDLLSNPVIEEYSIERPNE